MNLAHRDAFFGTFKSPIKHTVPEILTAGKIPEEQEQQQEEQQQEEEQQEEQQQEEQQQEEYILILMFWFNHLNCTSYEEVILDTALVLDHNKIINEI